MVKYHIEVLLKLMVFFSEPDVSHFPDNQVYDNKQVVQIRDIIEYI